MLGIFDRIHDAHLQGTALLTVMLACFLVGAFSMRLALQLDAKTLWTFILSRKPNRSTPQDHEEGEHE